MADEKDGTPSAPAAKTIEYPEHPFVQLNPVASDEELDALMLNIKVVGIQEAIVLWKTGRTTWIIDGRNRLKSYNRLMETGSTLCDNGVPLSLPTFYMPDETTELEALHFVLSKGRRRNLGKGQKAAAGVVGHLAMVKAMKKAGLPFEVPGDRADFVAKASGSNRLYCTRCFQMHGESADLFDAVFNGSMSVNDGFRKLERRRLGLADEPTPEQAAAEAEKAAEPEVITDADGTVIEDKKLKDVFAAKKDFTETVSYLNKAKTALYAAGESKGGKHLEVEALDAILKDAIKIIRGSQPHRVCPVCTGDPEARKACANCGKQGWICQRVAKVAEKLAAKGDDAAAGDDAGGKKKPAKKAKAGKGTRKRAAKDSEMEIDPVTGEEKPKKKKPKKGEAVFGSDDGEGAAPEAEPAAE